MYYKRNPVDGKVQAAGAGAYNPAGMKDGEVKARNFMFGDVNVKPISDGTKWLPEIPAEVQRLRAFQAHYANSVPHGVPVHLMHGYQRYLYKGIWAGLLTAMTYQVWTVYKQAYDLK